MKHFLQSILMVVALSLAVGLVACSGGSSSGGGGGGGSNPISVSISSPPPGNMTVNGDAAVTATVSNDSANAGVTWSCTPSSACGSFSPTSTGSGIATTFIAPAAVPSSSVTVTATSVTDSTKSASATVAIGHIPLASGNYVFSLSGSNTSSLFYDVAGVFTVNGDVITGGEQDYVDNFPTPDLHDAINPTGSFVTTTTDGNLQIVLTTCLAQDCTQVDSVIGGGNGIEVINGSLISASTCGTAGGPCQGRLVEFDSVSTSSGRLELQDPTAAAATPAGNYAFGVQGVPGLAVAIAGILDFSGSSVSTSGTVFDVNNGGTASTAQTISAGSVGAPDVTGRLQLSITPTNTAFPIFSFAAYVVDANHIRLVQAASPLSGVAYLQNPSGLPVSASSYVAALGGFDGFGPFQAAGILTIPQLGTPGLTGTISYNDLVSAQTPAVGITGTYTPDGTFPGRASLTGVTDGTNTFDINLYFDGDGRVLALTLDAGAVLSGEGYVQTASTTFSGTYVMNATGADGSSSALELDAVGPATTGSGTFSGFADFNWLGGPLFPNEAVSGAFTTPVGGVSTGAGNTLTGLDALLGGSQADAFDYYVIDANTVIGIEVDSNQNTLATFDLTQ